jgi:hypothetical protein
LHVGGLGFFLNLVNFLIGVGIGPKIMEEYLAGIMEIVCGKLFKKTVSYFMANSVIKLRGLFEYIQIYSFRKCD